MKKSYCFLIIFLLLIILLMYLLIKPEQDSKVKETNKNRKTNMDEILVETKRYEGKDFHLSMEHYYDEDHAVEYWVTTISPKNQKTLKTLIKKSFAYTKNGQFNTFAKESPLHHANRLSSIFAINASAWNRKTHQTFGVQVKDGVVYQNTSNLGNRAYTLGITNKGIMNVYSSTITGKELVSKYHIVNTFTFSIPIIMNGKEVNQNIYNSYAPSYKKMDPRQIIGQVKGTNDIIVLTVDGRTNRSKGLTLHQAANILLSRNCRIAYNLDGGGSVQTIFQGKVINNPSDKKLRPTSDLLYFK
ncbi:phosphodiester glycosidase family protein [Heyndrickxia sporothermodurans]|uniref:phosphodiester glycosidase family protein n=1 Tax=Heyndrickxia sporothermodurans TaxID=46224 RepID=UPI003D1F6A19